jgi:hypothetical protein
VRGHHQRAIVALEELLEPDQALEVQVVARLVEQHHVGPHEQDARKRDPHLPAARQRPHVSVHHLGTEAQAGEHLAGARLERIAVKLLEASLHLAIARNDLIHVVGLVRIRHGGLERLELGRNRAHRTGTIHHLGDGAAARHLADVLAEIADGYAALDRQLAFIRLLLASDQPEQCGLAGTVGTDESDLLALLECRRGFDEQDLVAVLLADAVETDHAGLGTGDCTGD